MKILIAYDGSECSQAALDDLSLAGLPREVEASVLSVVEVWLPPPPEGMSITEYARDLQSHPQPFKAWEEHANELSGAEATARAVKNRLSASFPAWKVAAKATYGSPSWEILAEAHEMKADLIVVGSHGRSAVARFLLGSISQKVLTEADCSVRVARGRVEIDPGPCRIVIGFDGSIGALAAVEAVASRIWPKESQVKLVAVTDSTFQTDMAAAPVILPVKSDWILEIADAPIRTLRESGMNTEFVHAFGNPKSVLVEVAEEWHADSIFVGANRWGSRVERFLLGSVSAAVAARAHCTVEVVRKKNGGQSNE
jgi:nucleotide-binding universal stress UspA family protein